MTPMKRPLHLEPTALIDMSSGAVSPSAGSEKGGESVTVGVSSPFLGGSP